MLILRENPPKVYYGKMPLLLRKLVRNCYEQHGLESISTLNLKYQLLQPISCSACCMYRLNNLESTCLELFVGRLHVLPVQYLLAKISQAFTDARLFIKPIHQASWKYM